MQYCSYQITIFANLPPLSKSRLVRPAPLATPLVERSEASQQMTTILLRLRQLLLFFPGQPG